MRPQEDLVRRAVAKKRKVSDEAEGSERRHRPRTAAQLPVLLAQPAIPIDRQQVPAAIPSVDLTADSPPMEPRVAVEPTPSGVEPAGTGAAGPGVEQEGPRPEGPPEGSPVGVSPVEGGPPSSSSSPVASARARVEGNEAEAVPSRPSLMNQGHRAERLMVGVCLPEFQSELHRQGASAFFRDAYVAQLWATNSITALKEVLRQSDAATRQIRAELGKARARAEAAETSLSSIQADRGELEEARRLLEVALSEQSERAAEIERLTQQLAGEQERARIAHERWESAKATVRAQDQRIDSFRAELELAEQRAARAEEYARQADNKAVESENAAKAAEERVVSAHEGIAAAEKATAAARAAAAAAEEAASRAIDSFRKSIAFEEELADATTGSYLLGFRDCKEKVSRIYGLAEVEDMEPDEPPEAPSSPVDAAGCSVMPTERVAGDEPSPGESRVEEP